MGWFTPKCPRCNGELEATGYSAFLPQWRCRSCIKRNQEKEEQQNEIAALKQRLQKLEKAQG